jgi:acyl-CoA thioesterase-1
MDDMTVTIVAFGDSITNAVGHFGVTERTCFRGRVQRTLQEEMRRPVRVVNAGVNGDITPLALERFDSDVASHSPDLVTVMFGVNDAGFYRPQTDSFANTPRVDIEEFTACMRRIVERIKALPASAALLTPLPMNHHYWGVDHPQYVVKGLNFLVEQYAQRVRDGAAEFSTLLVDTYGHFSSHPETVDLVPDGIHPNPEGHRVIAEMLMPMLKECY